MEAEKIVATVGRVEKYVPEGVMSAVFGFFCGRATTFAIAFTICGIVLAFRGKLDMNYMALVTAIQALVFAHSWKEDVHDQRMSRLEREGKTEEDAK